MNRVKKCIILSLIITFCSVVSAIAADPPAYTRNSDSIYSRKHGVSLTMDVIMPTEKHNGAAVVYCVSGGWYSSVESIQPVLYAEFLRRGYTVFAIVHGSQPKYTIPEIIQDMHRAVRFVRYYAHRYDVDPNRIAITGGSAGGHLSLMMGTTGTMGDPEAKDPIDRLSSKVQAVGCFFPPTDFMNYGRQGHDLPAVLNEELKDFKAPFDFVRFDKESKRMVLITDEKRRLEIARDISPITHVTGDDPPTLIIHGDADKLVPIQQAETMIARLKQAGVPAKLVTKPDVAHGWPKILDDMVTIADWFDKYLATSTTQPNAN